MKKLSILSLLVIFTMLLAACGGGGTTDTTPGAGTAVGGVGTSVGGAGTAVGGVGTSVGGGLDMTGTPVVGGTDMTSTPAGGGLGTTSTATVSGGAGMTSTPTVSTGGVGAGTRTPAVPVTGDQTSQDCVKASHLIGLNVVNKNGDDLGEVNDAIVDVRTSKIQYIVLGAGGVLGIGEKNIPIPWNMVDTTDFTCDMSTGSTGTSGSVVSATATPAAGVVGSETGTPTVSGSDNSSGSSVGNNNGVNFVDHLVVDVQKDSFKNAPTIDLNNVDFSVSTWDQEFNTFWMNVKSGAGASNSGSGSTSGMATATPTVSGSTSGSGNSGSGNSGQSSDNSLGVVNIVLLSKLLDADVYSNAGVGNSTGNSGAGNGTSGSTGGTGTGTGTGTGLDMTATPATGTGTSGNSGSGNSSDKGDKIGSVKEVIYDGKTGMVQYVVIDPDDIVVSNDVLIPVPLQALNIHRAESGSNDLRIMVNQNQLSSAPNFPTDSFPYGVQGWDTELNGFWSTGSSSGGSSSGGSGSGG